MNKSEREIYYTDDDEKYVKEVEKFKKVNMYKNRKEKKRKENKIK